MISYAQNFEDVMLMRALREVGPGFYVDIGAQDPVVDSVSLGLYEEGWRGVHVEPTPAYAEALRKARPDETVAQVAIGTETANIPFFEIPNTGISTGEEAIAKKHEAAGFNMRRIEVPCITLAALFETIGEREIHWLKIDVEGMEGQVLRSWGAAKARPWIVLIESTRPGTPEPTFQDWEPVILGLGYEFAYSDGLNRYYVSDAHPELLGKFEQPPNVFDNFSLSGSASNGFCKRLNDVIEANRVRLAELTASWNEQEAQLAVARPDVGYRARFLELEQAFAEQRKNAEARLQEALAHAKQVGEALRRSSAAKDESVQTAHRLRDQLAQRSQDVTLRKQEIARLERTLDQREQLIAQLKAEVASTRESLARLNEDFARQREEARAKFRLPAILNNPLRGLLTRSRRPELPGNTAENTTMTDPRPLSSDANVGALLTQFDVAFVRNCYSLLLGREADPSGLETYLTKLRDGESRENIIAEIALSEEGQAAGRTITGLEALLKNAAVGKPTLARRLQQRISGDSLESLARTVRAQENRNATTTAEFAARLNQLESALRSVEATVAQDREASRTLIAAHKAEALESTRLIAQTKNHHLHLQNQLFHRLKAAVQR